MDAGVAAVLRAVRDADRKFEVCFDLHPDREIAPLPPRVRVGHRVDARRLNQLPLPEQE
jgi:hypothetical protein